MTRSPTRISDHLGREYLIVSTYDVLRWSYVTARETLLEVLRDGMGVADVRRIAEQCGYTGEASTARSSVTRAGPGPRAEVPALQNLRKPQP
jgi:hypothetical protein